MLQTILLQMDQAGQQRLQKVKAQQRTRDISKTPTLFADPQDDSYGAQNLENATNQCPHA